MINYRARCITLEEYLNSFGQNVDKATRSDKVVDDHDYGIRKENAIRPDKSKNHSKVGKKTPPSSGGRSKTPIIDPLDQPTKVPPEKKKKCAKELFPEAEDVKGDRYAERWKEGKKAGFNVSDLAQTLNAPVPLEYRKIKCFGKKAKAAVEWRLATLRMFISTSYKDNADGNCVFESGKYVTSLQLNP